MEPEPSLTMDKGKLLAKVWASDNKIAGEDTHSAYLLRV